jgi:hypothetical protein
MGGFGGAASVGPSGYSGTRAGLPSRSLAGPSNAEESGADSYAVGEADEDTGRQGQFTAAFNGVDDGYESEVVSAESKGPHRRYIIRQLHHAGRHHAAVRAGRYKQ